jgi:indolepyruvate ferredoxin oxidoreductase
MAAEDHGPTPGNHATAVQLAALPETIRGYGHIREASAAKAAQQREALIVQWLGTGQGRKAV